MEDNNSAAIIMGLGTALTESQSVAPPQPGSSTPFVVIPKGYEVQDIERLFPAPTRRRGNVVLRDAASFISYVNDNAESGSTRLYGSKIKPMFLAVFNDNTKEAPGWRDFSAEYLCPISVEWKVWTDYSCKIMKQAEFADFIEKNAPDCVSPPAADMIEISRTLEAKKQVNFASGIRLDNGQYDLTYEETIQGTAAKGRLQIPTEFTIGIAVLEGGDKYSVQARLRYRIDGSGGLAMWYELVRPHKIVEDAANGVRSQIEEGTGFKVFNGE